MKQAKLLNQAEFKRLAAVIDSKRHAIRNHTVVALSFFAGLRACEIAALKVGDGSRPSSWCKFLGGLRA